MSTSHMHKPFISAMCVLYLSDRMTTPNIACKFGTVHFREMEFCILIPCREHVGDGIDKYCADNKSVWTCIRSDTCETSERIRPVREFD